VRRGIESIKIGCKEEEKAVLVERLPEEGESRPEPPGLRGL
jgi:hypothetical protein